MMPLHSAARLQQGSYRPLQHPPMLVVVSTIVWRAFPKSLDASTVFTFDFDILVIVGLFFCCELYLRMCYCTWIPPSWRRPDCSGGF